MSRSRKIVSLVVVIAFCLSVAWAGEIPTASPEQVGFSPERLNRVSEFAKRYVDDGKLAGLITLVARNGKIAHLETFGWKDRDSKAAMTPDSIFRIYSMSKPITTVAAMILYEEGRFRLNDPIEKFLPEFKGLTVLTMTDSGETKRVPTSRPVTIRQLMNHTAGFTYGVFGDSAVDRMVVESGAWSETSLAGFTQKIGKLPLVFQPGTHWRYSVAVDILGRLVEVVSGKPFDQFLQDRLFKPLDMTDTGFFVPAGKINRFASCYSLQMENGKPKIQDGKAVLTLQDQADKSRFAKPPAFLSGGGGMVSTTRDYLRFLQMLLNGGELDGVRILSRKTVELMTCDHLARDVVSPLDAGGFGFGLGFAVLKNVPATGVSGSIGEYNWSGMANTLFWVDPKEKLIAILMTQLIPYDAYPLRDEFKSAIYQAIVD